jgi:hypothetical protein
MPLQTPTSIQASSGTYTNGVLVPWEYGGDISDVSRWDIYKWEDGEAPKFHDSEFSSTTSYLDSMNVFNHPSSANTKYHYAIDAYSYFSGSSALRDDDIGYFSAPSMAPSIYGTNDSEEIDGTNGSDLIYGLGGNDNMYGYRGADTLIGGSGKDSLAGGVGKDSLTGGNGNDTFIFNTSSESSTSSTSSDIITDFVWDSDKINLSSIDAFASSNRNDNFVWNGTSAFNSTTKGEVRYEKFDNTGSANDYTMVWIDHDSDTSVEMAIRLTGLHNLTQSDFVL